MMSVMSLIAVACVIEACLFLTRYSRRQRHPAVVVNSWVIATSQTSDIRWHYVRKVIYSARVSTTHMLAEC